MIIIIIIMIKIIEFDFVSNQEQLGRSRALIIDQKSLYEGLNGVNR